jgi:hypothetical protein
MTVGEHGANNEVCDHVSAANVSGDAADASQTTFAPGRITSRAARKHRSLTSRSPGARRENNSRPANPRSPA